MSRGHHSLVAAADQAAKMYDNMLDCCIEATEVLAAENPDLDAVMVRAVSVALMSETYKSLPRQAFIDLLATAVCRLAKGVLQ